MNGANFSIDNNVTLTVIGPGHTMKQRINKHNKATKNMVLGLIKFLRGELTPSNVSGSVVSHNIKQAKQYIPAFISFGDGGLAQIGTYKPDGTLVADIDDVVTNIKRLSSTKFVTNDMTHELVGNSIGNTNNTNNITATNLPFMGRLPLVQTSYNSDTSDSLTLKLSGLITKGYYPSNFYTAYQRETNTPIYLSELGLWANDYNGSSGGFKGNLLARVTFYDEAVPKEQNYGLVTQSKNDVILVEWRIEITSLDVPFDDDLLVRDTTIEWES